MARRENPKPERAAGAGFILVVNAGSSSLKFSLFRTGTGGLELAARGLIDGLGTRPRLAVKDGGGATLESRDLAAAEAREVKDAVVLAGDWLRAQFGPDAPLLAVGHRVVHGGPEYSRPVLVDAPVLDALERLIPLAPLHQPHNLAAIRSLRETRPEVPQVACFDTAFHRGHPQLADLYALPWAYYEAGVRRYGFHGLSYEYIAAALPQVSPAIAGGRVIVAHLGSGASLCALRAGKSVDSTMGFSALDGLPMGTRPGALDPGVLLYLVGERGMAAAALEKLLYKESGLLGISGVSNDMRLLLESRRAAGAAGGRLLRLPRRAGDRRARRVARRRRRARVHRGRRRELGGDPRPGRGGLRLAGRGS